MWGPFPSVSSHHRYEKFKRFNNRCQEQSVQPLSTTEHDIEFLHLITREVPQYHEPWFSVCPCSQFLNVGASNIAPISIVATLYRISYQNYVYDVSLLFEKRDMLIIEYTYLSIPSQTSRFGLYRRNSTTGCTNSWVTSET